MPSHRRSVLAVFAAAVLGALPQFPFAQAGQAQHEPLARPAETLAPFRAGERFDYDIRWATLMSAASARLTVVERRAFFGRDAWHFQATASTLGTVRLLYELDDQFDSYTDGATLVSLQFERYLREQDKRENSVARMAVEGEHPAGDGPAVRVLPGTRDALAYLYYLRTVDWARVRELRTPVFDGKKLYELQARLVSERDAVSVPAGQFTAWKIELRAFERGKEPAETRFRLWLAQDAARTPALIEADMPFGLLRVELQRAER